MKKQMLKILNGIGLNEKEAKVYLTLLEINDALPSIIARKSGIKRSTTYTILESLQVKGLVSHFTRKSNLHYRAADPRQILETQKNKTKDFEKALPSLLRLNTKYEATPQMSVFEGKEGLIQVMEDTLTTKGELLCWADIDIATGTILEDYYPKYIKKKVKHKVPLRGIFCYNKTAIQFKKRGKQELREVYLIPKGEFTFNNEINIYDDKIAIISHTDKIGVIIQNQNIADTQRAIFNFAFKHAKKNEHNVLSDEDKEYLSME